MLDKTSAPTPIRAAQAILDYLATLPALASATFRRDDDPRQAPFPRLVVGCFNFRQSWAGSDEMEGELRICYISGRDEDADSDNLSARDGDLVANQTAHHTAAAAIAAALEDQAALKAFVNSANLTRAVRDFHLYALLEHQETNERHDELARWQTDFMRKIVCARCDYA